MSNIIWPDFLNYFNNNYNLFESHYANLNLLYQYLRYYFSFIVVIQFFHLIFIIFNSTKCKLDKCIVPQQIKISNGSQQPNTQFIATLWPQPICPGQCQTWLSQLGPRRGIIITLYLHPPVHMFLLNISQPFLNGLTWNFAWWFSKWKGSSLWSKQWPCSTAVLHAALQNL